MPVSVTDLWSLPRAVTVAERELPVNADFRNILQIIACLEDSRFPEFYRWHRALRLFYEQPVPRALEYGAMEAMAEFIRYGAPDKAGPKLLDWQQDAPLIISDVNKAAGQELRSLPFLHWWTFLGWFNAIGQGQLSTVVAIREKLRTGKKLEAWEQDFYRQNKQLVELKNRLSAREQAEKDRLNKMLDGAGDFPNGQLRMDN